MTAFANVMAACLGRVGTSNPLAGNLLLRNDSGLLLLRGGGNLLLRNPAAAPGSPLVQPSVPALANGQLRAVGSRTQMGEPTPMTTKTTDRHTVQMVETNFTGEAITGMRVAFFNGSLSASGTVGEAPGTSSKVVLVSIWDGVAWNTAISKTYATGEFSVEAEVTLANPIQPGAQWAHWTSIISSDFTFAIPRLIWGDYGDWSSYDDGSGAPMAPPSGALHASLGAGVSGLGWPPMAIYGRTASMGSRRAVGLIGTSITTGNGGGEIQSIPKTAYGYPERGLQGHFGLIKCSVPSGSLFSATILNTAQIAAFQNGGVTDVFIEEGINDFGGSKTYGDVYSRFQVLLQQMKNLGIRTHIPTLGPRVTTSDSLLTTAGQTPTSGCGPSEYKGQWNAKLRNHYSDPNPIPNLDHVHDVAAAVESSLGSCLWKVDGVTPYRYGNNDGTLSVHPTDESAALLGAAINLSKFAA